MLSSEDNILIKTCGNRKDKRWTTFCERCTQPVRPKALQEAVGNSHPRPADNIAVIKLKTPIKRSCKFCNFSVECSFLFPLVQSVQKFTKNMAVIIENRVARFYGPQCTCSECQIITNIFISASPSSHGENGSRPQRPLYTRNSD